MGFCQMTDGACRGLSHRSLDEGGWGGQSMGLSHRIYHLALRPGASVGDGNLLVTHT